MGLAGRVNAVPQWKVELDGLFERWFDPGFLDLKRITWQSPALVLEKLMAYEAVHPIASWTDLRNRLDTDRRCYAFFHPRLPDEPLIFVEIALLKGMPRKVAFTHPLTGRPEEVTLTREGLLGLVRPPLYAPQVAAALPAAIHEASLGRFDALAGLALERARLGAALQTRLRLGGVLAACAAVVALWSSVQMWPDPLGRWTQRDLYPDAAVQYLKAIGRPLRILNQYNWGGYLMLHLPDSQVFMDGRANTLYDERIYEDVRVRAQTFEVLTGGSFAADHAEGAVGEKDDEGLGSGISALPLPAVMLQQLRVRLEVHGGRPNGPECGTLGTFGKR